MIMKCRNFRSDITGARFIMLIVPNPLGFYFGWNRKKILGLDNNSAIAIFGGFIELPIEMSRIQFRRITIELLTDGILI